MNAYGTNNSLRININSISFFTLKKINDHLLVFIKYFIKKKADRYFLSFDERLEC